MNRVQIQLAIENMARLILKIEAATDEEEKQSPEEVNLNLAIEGNIEETWTLMKIIYGDLAFQSESPLPSVLNFPSLPNNISPKKVALLRGAEPIAISPKTSVKETPLMQEKIRLASPITLTHLQDFIGAIKAKRETNEAGINETVINSIEDLLLSLPLDSKTYADIDTPAKASELIELMSELLSIYGESCNREDSEQCFGPQRVIALFSALSAITVSTQKDELSVYGKGVSAQFYKNIKELLLEHKHYAFMSSKNPILDARFEEITQLSNEVQTPENKKDNSFDFYTAMIDAHPQKDNFIKYLLDLFNNEGPTQFKDKEGLIDLVRKKHKEAEVALAVLMNQTNTPSEYRLQLEKCENKVKYEQVSNRIIKGLSSFNYGCLSTKDPLKNQADIKFEKDRYDKANEKFYYDDINGSALINNRLSQYGAKFTNMHIGAPLYCKGNVIGSNNVYSSLIQKLEYELAGIKNLTPGPLKGDSERQIHTKDNEYLKMVWELRADPKSCILHTIDYFNENLELLADPDYQQYFLKNIFDPSSLLSCLKDNPEAYATIEKFIQRGLRISELDNKDLKTTLFFYTLEYDFNQYILRTQNQALKKLYFTKSIETLKALKSTLLEKGALAFSTRNPVFIH